MTQLNQYRIILCNVLRNGLLPLAVLLTLSGCDVASRDTTNDGFSMSSLAGYNFSTHGIHEFYVDGAWGSGVGIGDGGGSVCCVRIPSKWHEGLQVTVEWRRGDCLKGVDENGWSNCRNDPVHTTKILKKTIPIEPYSEPGITQVMFLPNDEIKIFITDKMPTHPEHPSGLGGARPLSLEEYARITQK